MAKIKITLSKLDTNKQKIQKQSSKMLIYWSVPDCLVTPGTESLTRHIDLLDAVTHTHLQLMNLAEDKPVSTFSSSHHGYVKSRHKCFLAFCKYNTKGRDLRPAGRQPFGSSLFKAAVINFQVHGTFLIQLQNGRQSA